MNGAVRPLGITNAKRGTFVGPEVDSAPRGAVVCVAELEGWRFNRNPLRFDPHPSGGRGAGISITRRLVSVVPRWSRRR